MSKRVRSLVSLMMSVIMLLSIGTVGATTVSAEETSVQPRLSYTNYTFTGLDITTAGLACCTADVEGYDGITTKVHIRMTLQKYTVLWWSDQITWENAFTGIEGALCRNTTVTSSGRYRVRAVYTVYSGSASEEIIGTSQEFQYNP